MRKLHVRTLMLTALAATALSACGAKRVFDEDIDISVNTKGTEIILWTGFGASVSSALDTVLEEFTDATGIKATHESQGGYDNLQKAINGSASSMTYPNVCVGYPDHFAGYIDSDIQMRLDVFIEQDKKLWEEREDKKLDDAKSGSFYELPAFDLDDFYPNYMVENQSLEFDEEGNPYTLGIPFNKSSEVMVYNKTFFESSLVQAAGITLPKTWLEAAATGQEIIELIDGKHAWTKVLGDDGNLYASLEELPEGVGLVIDLTGVTKADFKPMSYDSQANLFITGVRQWGGTYTAVDPETREGFIKFQEGNATADMLSELKDLYDSNILGIPQTWGEASYCSTPFKARKSLMNIGSTAGVTNAIPVKDVFSVGAAPIPFHDANQQFVISQGTNLGILKVGTKEETASAWKLVKWLSQIENGTFAALTGYFPTCKQAMNSEDYQGWIKSPRSSNDKINVEAAKVNAEVYDDAAQKWTKFVDPGFNGSSTIRTDIGAVTAEVFIDHEDINSCIQKHVNNLLDYVQEA